MFKLFKGPIGDIIADKARVSFGFDTKKEAMDKAISKYQREDADAAKQSIAKRNIVISSLKQKKHYYDQILQRYNHFLELYNKIHDIATEEIKKGDSEVEMSLKDRNGTVIAVGNFAALSSVIMLPQFSTDIVFYSGALQQMATEYIDVLIDAIESGRGNAEVNGKQIKLSELYDSYLMAYQFVQDGYVTDLHKQSFYPQNSGSRMLAIVKDFIYQYKGMASSMANNFSLSISKLENAQHDDERTLQIIEEAKQLIITSEEYVRASASDEYLKEFGKK